MNVVQKVAVNGEALDPKLSVIKVMTEANQEPKKDSKPAANADVNAEKISSPQEQSKPNEEVNPAQSSNNENESADTFIPKVFQNTGKPEVLTEETIKDLPNAELLKSAIASGGTVKLFELTNPVDNGQKIADKYKTQYELNTYDKNGVRSANYRLDSEKKLIVQELA